MLTITLFLSAIAQYELPPAGARVPPAFCDDASMLIEDLQRHYKTEIMKIAA